MRKPSLAIDKWCLDDAEEYHRQSPETFRIPELLARQSLQVGDFAKLIFRIEVEHVDATTGAVEVDEEVERMWVLVRECDGSGYFGVLDNEPCTVDENDEFWLGTEIPFHAGHVMEIVARDEATVAQAAKPPVRAWNRT